LEPPSSLLLFLLEVALLLLALFENGNIKRIRLRRG
jgi:hypothetical protein